MRNPNTDPTFGEIGRRWLQGKKDELFGKNHRRAEGGVAAQDAAERDAVDKVAREAFLAAVPGLRGAMERQERKEEQQLADERAAVLGLPRAELSLRVSGAVNGSWRGALPVRIETWDGGVRDWELVVPDGAPPLVAGVAFYGLRFRLEGYHGAGVYDPAAGADEPDPFAYECLLGSRDEGFYWVASEGPASISVAPDERTITVAMATTGASGTLQVDATVILPVNGP